MTIHLKANMKGLLIGEFTDRSGQICSIQESSMPSEECLWLGVDTDLNNELVINGRMHLTRERAKDLIPLLRCFARTGFLARDDTQEVFHVGAWVRGVGEHNKGVEGRVEQVVVGTSVVIQDRNVFGPQGSYQCTWDVLNTLWEPMEPPETGPGRYALILEEGNL